MGNQKTAFIEIVNWFNSGQDYEEGLLILQRYSRKRTIIKNLLRGENEKRKEKLIWQLHKIANLPQAITTDKKGKLIREIMTNSIDFKDHTVEAKPKTPVAGKTTGKKDTLIAGTLSSDANEKKYIEISAAQEDFNSKIAEYPDPVQDAIRKKGELHAKRAVLHKKLKKVTQNNGNFNIAKRKAILKDYKPIWIEIERLWNLIKQFEKDLIIPDELTKKPEVPKKKMALVPIAKMDEAQLLRAQRNLRAAKIKQENRLEYQSRKKEKVSNPMPAGTARTKVEKNVVIQQKNLDLIDKRLKNLK